MSAQGLNLLVFREGRRPVRGSCLKANLARRLNSLPTGNPSSTELLSALLQAGEFECALADCGLNTPLPEITDRLAAALLNSGELPDIAQLAAVVNGIVAPAQLSVSTPEGFAFYGLHPLSFADAVQEIPNPPERVGVIGIRSIGTTLSAVTLAALRRRGVQAERITVRPIGHPYNRRTEFSPPDLEFVRNAGMFLIVDEGPGLSGSSFLSVAEALTAAGVNRKKITLMCTHAPDPDRLCAEDAAARWRAFRTMVIPQRPRLPSAAQVWIGGGEWRRYVLRDEAQWPAAWTTFERAKYLSGPRVSSPRSSDPRGFENVGDPRFYKFAGFGVYGEDVRKREERVADGGFAPPPQAESAGYVSYPWIDGRPMTASNLSESVLARMAAYCAFRHRAFSAETADASPLQAMAHHNLRELKYDADVNLRIERPTIPDGRMQPYEWILSNEGQMLKTDCGSHGDDHFFPGTTDIAWDLAGAIVEWRMDAAEARIFLEMYRRASGDDASGRIKDYLMAYIIFRCAYCKMAANAMQGTEEQRRLQRSAEMYLRAGDGLRALSIPGLARRELPDFAENINGSSSRSSDFELKDFKGNRE
jgi:hypothetical protein